MKKYQIVESAVENNHAGYKAVTDIATVAERLGYQRVNIKMNTQIESAVGKIRRQIGYYFDWKTAEKEIAENSILLLQHPFHHKQLIRDEVLETIKRKKHVKIISLVHDVEKLRGFRYNNYYAHEFQMMLKLADIIIVHNKRMMEWFLKQGVDEKRLVILEVFDYLQNEQTKMIQFENSVTIAGNLDTVKSGYIGQLSKIKGVKIHLYGPNFNEKLKSASNIEYHGSLSTSDIPKKLNKGFGLVWDGESIDGCQGESGQYLKYNSPHKLSLYVSSGIPVIIWKDAAEAEFVEKNGIGILISSLRDIEDYLNGKITESDYADMVERIQGISSKMKNGLYCFFALKKAELAIKLKN